MGYLYIWLALSTIIGLWLFYCFENKFRFFGLFIAGVGIAPLGLLLAQSRTGNDNQRTENDNKRTKNDNERTENEKKRRIDEKFSRTIELLGNAEVAARQGAIYALGDLAKENKEMYETVIRIVSSYIRQTNPNTTKTIPEGIDIEAALSVIKNRRKDWDTIPERDGIYVFDLSSSKILNGDLSNTELAKVNLSQIYAKGFLFENTDFSKSNMVAAKFENCDFTMAIFKEAELNEVEFLEAEEKGKCTFKYADFTNADLKDTVFSGADLSGANLSNAKNLIQEQINKAVGNSETKLPSGITPPKHWTT